ncbi:MAG: FecR domain-containing protein [Spirochaetes bacterium]|nr:FecR domain-containing protein [Spirochaetota bacterium]
MMKYAILSALAIALITPSASDAAQVGFYLGDVKLLRKGRESKVAMGQQLQSGDMLKTGKGAIVDVSYSDGSKIQIKENSTAQIGSKGIPSSDSVSLVSGNLSASFAKMIKSGRKTYSPTVIAAVRGTEYTMTVSKGGDTRIDMKDGKVIMRNPYGQTELERGENGEAEMAKAPEEDPEGTTDEWLSQLNASFDANPQERSERMSDYIQRLDDNTKEADRYLDREGAQIAKETDKERLKKAGVELQNLAEKSEDEMMLNESASGAIDRLVNHYRDTETDLYQRFLQVKKESNRVMEQQRMNMKALAEVKEAYKKAYDRIMGTYRRDFQKIMDDSKFKSVLPNMNDFDE